MLHKIEDLRMSLEVYRVYRIMKNIHDWVMEQLDICKVFPMVLGMLVWPSVSVLCFVRGIISYGVVALLLCIAYWLHIILFAE